MSGAIAVPHVLATRAGKKALDAGSNVIDVALAKVYFRPADNCLDTYYVTSIRTLMSREQCV